MYHHYTRSAEDSEIKTRIWQKCDPQVSTPEPGSYPAMTTSRALRLTNCRIFGATFLLYSRSRCHTKAGTRPAPGHHDISSLQRPSHLLQSLLEGQHAKSSGAVAACLPQTA